VPTTGTLTRVITSHAVGAAIPKTLPDGKVAFAVTPYRKGNWTSIRHVMETGEPGEKVMDTLRSCLLHEVARNAVDFRWRLIAKEPIAFKLARDEHSNRGGLHMKVIFAVEIERGDIRNFEIQDGDEILAPMEWVETETLVNRMKGSSTPEFHIQAVYPALGTLMARKEVYDQYGRDVMRCQPPKIDLEAVAAYAGRW
jgi:hypothetical protein